MGKTNGQPEGVDKLDLEHELPPAEQEAGPQAASPSLPAGPESAASRAQLDELKAERDLLIDRLARQQAEFENARKRSAREQREFRDYAAAEAVKLLLPVLDNLDLAVRAETGEPELRAGVELIRKQMMDALAKLGVQPIRARGQQFDPRQHEAVEVIDSDQVPDHHVLEELQPGYKMKDRLLRPAMVRVARNSRK